MANAMAASGYVSSLKRSRPGAGGNYSGLHMGKEMKYVDTRVPAATLVTSAAPLLYHLNEVDQGTGVSERLADRTWGHQIKWNLVFDQRAADLLPTKIRCLIVYDRNTNGAVPSITDILNVPTGTLYSTNLFYKQEYKRRFTVLGDQTICFGIYNAGNPKNSHKMYGQATLKGNHKVTQFTATGGGISDIEAGSIYLVIVSTQATALQQPHVVGTTRYTFVG